MRSNIVHNFGEKSLVQAEKPAIMVRRKSQYKRNELSPPPCQSDFREKMSSMNSTFATPFAYIVEQPAKCGVRFRYECERRASVIRGARTGTFPTVAVAHYQGPLKVIVSCVTKDPPYRAHPHSIDSGGSTFYSNCNSSISENYTESLENANENSSCASGISVVYFPEPIAVFSQLGVLYAKRNAVKEALRRRERLGVDPFGTGFSHRSLFHKLIDFRALRLCFQVFIRSEGEEVEGDQQELSSRLLSRWTPLEPIVSEPIFDRKLCTELAIVRMSHDSAPASGGLLVVLLCERVSKEDIEVRFFQPSSGLFLENQEGESNAEVLWERLALFTPNDIHKNVAIVFTVPPYDGQLSITEAGGGVIPVQVQLRRPSDGCTSEPVAFYYHSNVSTSDNNITSMLDTQQFESYDQQEQSFFLDGAAHQCTEQSTAASTTWPLSEYFGEYF